MTTRPPSTQSNALTTDRPTTDGPRITHVARDSEERPLVGLCGTVQRKAGDNGYKGKLEERPLPCVVCLELHREARR